MSAREFLLEKFDNDEDALDQFLYDFSKSFDLVDIVVVWLEEYAQLKYKEQTAL